MKAEKPKGRLSAKTAKATTRSKSTPRAGRDSQSRNSLDQAPIVTRLAVQQSLLAQIKTCHEILQLSPEDRTVQDWKDRLDFMLSGQSQVAFDDVITDLLLAPALRSAIEFDLPSDKDHQALVGMAFAEAAGTDADEVSAVVGCLVNVAYYATYKEPSKKCYNSSFGDGTIISAIKMSSKAYDSAQWKRVMSGDQLLPKAKLEQTLIPTEVAKLKACCAGVAAVSSGQVPYVDAKSGCVLVQFNQAPDSPPSPRQEKAANYGAHTFYAFKAGRECQ